MKGTQMKSGKLNGKVAIVTGASKGIGAGIAKEFATQGASVVVNYASAKQDADRVVDEISKRGGKAIAIQGNVSKKSENSWSCLRTRVTRSITKRPNLVVYLVSLHHLIKLSSTQLLARTQIKRLRPFHLQRRCG
jgi:NAD(P)-dependent dehydrogenase (short-subunit alcohol dehydrogenase family)